MPTSKSLLTTDSFKQRLMFDSGPNDQSKAVRSVELVTSASWKAGKANLTQQQMAWATANDFKAAKGESLKLPSKDGDLQKVLFAFEDDNPLALGKLSSCLGEGNYQIAGEELENPQLAALGLALAAYRFEKYKKQNAKLPSFTLPKGADNARLKRAASATFLVRDLINTPTNDMGPDELEATVKALAKGYGGDVHIIKGDELLKKNFPMIHTVGRASNKAPRLIELNWGKQDAPKVTLVGKGVCFDTGGLNIKPGNSMALMKKDMGGAANVIGLAMMIMDAKLPVKLQLLIPAVENAISGNAFRPGDILPSRKGVTVEIGNTDAEGRLVLGDALAYGDEQNPDLMIDMATLTGAARVALGPDLPPFYTNDEALAITLTQASQEEHDPLWHMPLWAPYEKMLNSKIADCNHITSGGFAGSITAALFLKKFVNPDTPWVHLDVFGWNPAAKPWAPIGGEAQGIRALYKVIYDKYCRS